VKTWRGRPATNSSGSDNLLARVWALISLKYILFGVQHCSKRDASTLIVLRAFICQIDARGLGDKSTREVIAVRSGPDTVPASWYHRAIHTGSIPSQNVR
jgi:hypothetical protein